MASRPPLRPTDPKWATDGGHLFVLSGFVIGHRYTHRLKDWRGLIRFQWLRVGRLYPVHLLLVLAFLALEVAKYAAARWGLFQPQTEPFTVNNPETLAASLALIQAFGPTQWFLAFNPPAWSISVEFWCYILFGVVVLVSRGRAWIAFAILAGMTLLSFSLAPPPPALHAIMRCVAGFFTGALTAEAVRVSGWRSPAWLQALLFAAVFSYVGIVSGEHGDQPLLYLLTASLLFALATGDGGPMQHLLSLRPLLALGRWSYAIYLSHVLFIYIAAQIIMRSDDRPTSIVYGSAVPQFSLLEAFALQALVTATIIAFSAACYRFYERPLREWSRRQAGLAPSRSPPGNMTRPSPEDDAAMNNNKVG